MNHSSCKLIILWNHIVIYCNLVINCYTSWKVCLNHLETAWHVVLCSSEPGQTVQTQTVHVGLHLQDPRLRRRHQPDEKRSFAVAPDTYQLFSQDVLEFYVFLYIINVFQCFLMILMIFTHTQPLSSPLKEQHAKAVDSVDLYHLSRQRSLTSLKLQTWEILRTWSLSRYTSESEEGTGLFFKYLKMPPIWVPLTDSSPCKSQVSANSRRCRRSSNPSSTHQDNPSHKQCFNHFQPMLNC